MLKIEDFKCENCKGTGSVPDKFAPSGKRLCMPCYGDKFDKGKVIKLIESEGLDAVLAGIELIRAMKEEKAIVSMGTEDPLKFIKSTDEFYIAGTGAYISPLEGIHALLENWESTQ